jgi:hypothetical protein
MTYESLNMKLVLIALSWVSECSAERSQWDCNVYRSLGRYALILLISFCSWRFFFCDTARAAVAVSTDKFTFSGAADAACPSSLHPNRQGQHRFLTLPLCEWRPMTFFPVSGFLSVSNRLRHSEARCQRYILKPHFLVSALTYCMLLTL